MKVVAAILQFFLFLFLFQILFVKRNKSMKRDRTRKTKGNLPFVNGHTCERQGEQEHDVKPINSQSWIRKWQNKNEIISFCNSSNNLLRCPLSNSHFFSINFLAGAVCAIDRLFSTLNSYQDMRFFLLFLQMWNNFDCSQWNRFDWTQKRD